MSFIDRAVFKILKMESCYSQSGEDKILFHFFSSLGKDKITYLDIGTNHPQIHNNTYLFYRKGSSGVCIEPNPKLADLIRSTRSRDVCLNVGVSFDEERVADFYMMSSHTLSTFSKEDATALDRAGVYKIEETLRIQLRSINSILETQFTEPVDLISIDVEGWNEEVVRSIDFSRFRPLCLCVETLTFSDNGYGEKIPGITEFLVENGYSVYADTHINTIFVDSENQGKFF